MENVNEARLLTSTSSSLTEYFLKVSKAPSKSGLVMISLKRATTFMPQRNHNYTEKTIWDNDNKEKNNNNNNK